MKALWLRRCDIGLVWSWSWSTQCVDGGLKGSRSGGLGLDSRCRRRMGVLKTRE